MTLMAQALDFSGHPPGAAALVARGFRVVLRYIGLGSEGKQISRAEWQDYLNHGVQVLLVAELGTNDAWEGLDDYALGAARARVALADIDATAPPSVDRSRVLVACAADAHASSAVQIQDAVRYSQGFASVVGLWRSGFYGFSETSRAVHAAGAAGWHWRCGSEPSTADRTWVNFWQRNTPPQVVVIGGTPCDINEIYALPGQEEHPMALADDPDAAALMWRMEGIINGRDTVAKGPTAGEPIVLNRNLAKILAGVGELTDDEANLLAAIRALPEPGDVDEEALAAALAPLLAPLLNTGATPEQVEAAVRRVFADAGQVN